MQYSIRLAALAALTLASAARAAAPAPVDFNRDIRPILSNKCFACHGPDEATRAAGLRLDQPPPAGSRAIVAGRPERSELIRRVTRRGQGQMPPSGEPLGEAQVELLRRWITEGAPYAVHWAFVPPQRGEPPAVQAADWARNPIDRFILARLEAEGLRPSPEADKATLLRRATLDLTGLPPTLEELDAFLADASPDAYEKAVDRLLASPHYGERMALWWLDLARYADTHGYHIDSQRDMWPWRDWVIRAFAGNLPYDRFLLEQLAGDLLPEPTQDQQVATGFNRNHPINYEGGAIPEEYQAAYVHDRVDTTGTALMGLTMRCAGCHDHKFDPISMREYYQFYAYFNNIDEEGLDGQAGNAKPFIKVPTAEQTDKLAEYVRQIAALDEKLTARAAATAEAQLAWEQTALAQLDAGPLAAEGLYAFYQLDEAIGAPIADSQGRQPAGEFRGANERRARGKSRGGLEFDGMSHVDLGNVLDFERDLRFSYGGWVKLDGPGPHTLISRMEDARDFRGWDLYIADGTVFAHLIHKWPDIAVRVNTKQKIKAGEWTHVFVTYDGSSQAAGVSIYVNGAAQELDRTHDTLTDTIHTDVPARLGRRTEGAPLKGLIDEVRVYDRLVSADEVKQIARLEGIRPILQLAADQRNDEQRKTLQEFYLLSEDGEYQALSRERGEAVNGREALDRSIPTSMVMRERSEPRPTWILLRGQYDQHGEQVQPHLPSALGALPAGAPNNRLGLAQWLIAPEHPLAARVAVNQFWQLVFGTGLVKTAEDFGSQGERPSHPELLDWLAVQFRESGWDTKAMMRLILTSATYRQASRATPDLLARDPENRLLARGPRLRLKAELVRDLALASGGLLNAQIGGPSVKPYMDPQLWKDVAFGTDFSAQVYVQDTGDKLYRRSMYTFWKRSAPPPTMQTFDAPEREYCIVRRPTTNTPLQALVLLNETGFVEASRKFAERALAAGASPEERLRFAFRVATSRPPAEREEQILLGLLSREQAAFAADPARAEALLKVGESPADPRLDSLELASWTVVCNALLNLDETVTKG